MAEKKRFTEKEVMALFKSHGIIKVTFTKSNGDRRVMECTRSPELDPTWTPPVVDPDKPVKERAPVEGLCTAYEIGVGWRSFYYAKVIELGLPD